MHGNRGGALRLAVDEGEAEQHHETAIGVGPYSRQPACRHPHDGQEKHKRHEDLRVEDRVAKSRPRLDEDRDRRQRQDPDRGHEVEMRPLTVGHPEDQLGQMHRIAFVLAEVEGALHQRRTAEDQDEGRQKGRQKRAAGSAHWGL